MLLRHIIAVGTFALSAQAAAQAHSLRGSDTLAGVMTDAVIAADLGDKLVYSGGGSGLGEAGIVAKTQGIAPMSREFSEAKLAEARANGVEPIAHVIGLDGIGIFVNANNATEALTLSTIVKIFECSVTDWAQIGGSGRSGAIRVYRRNDNAGTTDAFKHMTGLKSFGACVISLEHTADIAAKTASDEDAIGYSGMTASREGNKAVKIARDQSTAAAAPLPSTIRDFTYPLARRLYIYEASGSSQPNAVERQFLDLVLDRSFMDPIVQDNEFYTVD